MFFVRCVSPVNVNETRSLRFASLPFPHIEVEKLRLLLVGSSLGQTGFVQVAVRHAGLDRLGGRAVGEALRHVAVVQHRHVLQRGQSRSPGLLHLKETHFKGAAL